jgi:RNA polymerase sigma factor (sigma-70 family)
MDDATVLGPSMATPVPVTACSDGELVALAGAGRVEAREELVRRHRDRAYLLAFQLLGNRDDALDMVQEAMLRFLSALDRLEPGRPVRPWLLAIVRNQVRDLWRRRRVRRAESIESAATALAGELVDRSPNPEEAAERLELRRRVWRAIAALPDEHREIIVLRDFHDLSYADISHVLSIRPGTVMSRLHGARQKLRAQLQGEVFHA